MAPPCCCVLFPLKVSWLIVKVAALQIAPPSYLPEFPMNVQLLTVAVATPYALVMAPPLVELLSTNVELVTTSDHLLKMPPPLQPVVFPVKIESVTVSVPELKIAPPEPRS